MKSPNKPQKTKFPTGVKIKRVSCGAYHTAALSGKSVSSFILFQ